MSGVVDIGGVVVRRGAPLGRALGTGTPGCDWGAAWALLDSAPHRRGFQGRRAGASISFQGFSPSEVRIGAMDSLYILQAAGTGLNIWNLCVDPTLPPPTSPFLQNEPKRSAADDEAPRSWLSGRHLHHQLLPA